MNDKSALLSQLKIDRDAMPVKSGGAGKWVLLGLVALAAAGGAAWKFRPADAVPIKAAIALAAASNTSAGSVLDASGYVVARRQATVSSQVTGKVVSLTIEE